MAQTLPSTPISIAPSASEVKNGALGQRNLEIAIRALARDGLVVLEDMVDHAVLDRLNKKMVQDAYQLQARKDSPFNYNKGNIQQDPPMTEEWFFDEIYISKRPKYSSLRMHENVLIPHRRSDRHSSDFDQAGSQTLFTVHVWQHSSASHRNIATRVSADSQ
jgi:hypothetical protein